MKLSEIVRIPSDPDLMKHTKPKVSNLRVIGKIENRDVFGNELEGSNGGFYLEHRDENDETIAFLVYQKISFKGHSYARVLRTWTGDKYQRLGYMSGLIMFIRKHQHLTIMSDEEQTPEAQNFWKSLMKGNSVKVLNLVTNEKIPANEFDLGKIYSSSKEPTDYRFILEEYDWSRVMRTEEIDIMFQNNFFEEGDI